MEIMLERQAKHQVWSARGGVDCAARRLHTTANHLSLCPVQLVAAHSAAGLDAISNLFSWPYRQSHTLLLLHGACLVCLPARPYPTLHYPVLFILLSLLSYLYMCTHQSHVSTEAPFRPRDLVTQACPPGFGLAGSHAGHHWLSFMHPPSTANPLLQPAVIGSKHLGPRHFPMCLMMPADPSFNVACPRTPVRTLSLLSLVPERLSLSSRLVPTSTRPRTVALIHRRRRPNLNYYSVSFAFT